MLFEQHEDYRPVMWLGGYPIYSCHCIVIAYIISMVVATVLGPVGSEGIAMFLEFDSRLVHHGQVWRVITYGLVNPPSLGFAIEMLMIVWFGREVERFFGRRIFLGFYAAIYLLAPLLFTLFGFIRPMTLAGATGGWPLFIAFATVYPGALMWFGIPAMWWAIGSVTIYTLINLYERAVISLAELWITVGFAFVFVRYQQGRLTLPTVRMPGLGRKRPKLRVLPDPLADEFAVDEEESSMPEVDALLDKIAKSGIGSLTAREREKLEKAREELLKKESPRR